MHMEKITKKKKPIKWWYKLRS